MSYYVRSVSNRLVSGPSALARAAWLLIAIPMEHVTPLLANMAGLLKGSFTELTAFFSDFTTFLSREGKHHLYDFLFTYGAAEGSVSNQISFASPKLPVGKVKHRMTCNANAFYNVGRVVGSTKMFGIR